MAIIGLQAPGMNDFADRVDDERLRQLRMWGAQPLPDGTGYRHQIEDLAVVRGMVKDAEEDGELSHALVLAEEVYEVYAETDPVKLKEELIQVAAVCAKWIADIDARQKVAEQAV